MNNKQLSILPANKTTVFYSPIEGKEVLVRTGIINEGSPFVHAVLHSYSQDYIKMSDKEKCRTADKLSKSITEKVERARWEDKFNISTMLNFQEGLKDKIQDFYRRINGSTIARSSFFEKLEKKDVETYKVICEIVKLEHFTKDILPETYNLASNKSLEKFKEEINNQTTFFSKKIFDNLGNAIEKKRKKYCTDKIVTFISDIVDEVEASVFKKYLNSKNDQVVTLDSHTVNFLSDRFNRNIYFIDAANRLPYKLPNVSYKKRKSVVVIWLGDYHYEPVGKLLPQNRIQREFNSDDELIKTIDTFISKPKQLLEKNPQLGKYLNKKESDVQKNRHNHKATTKPHRVRDSSSDTQNTDEDSETEDSDTENSDTEEDSDSETEDSSTNSEQTQSPQMSD